MEEIRLSDIDTDRSFAQETFPQARFPRDYIANVMTRVIALCEEKWGDNINSRNARQENTYFSRRRVGSAMLVFPKNDPRQ